MALNCQNGLWFHTPVMTVTTTATNGLPTAFTPIACRTSLLPRASAHGVIKHLSSAASVLEKVRLKALPDLSSALQLDPSVVLGDNQPQNSTPPGPAAPVANASASETLEAPLSVASKEHKSRKGLHVCLYCDRTFSNASLFASHVKRPVARVVYRCHLCSLSPGAGGLPRDTVVVPALNPDARGGMLSASNLCALYVHMAICHAAEPVSNWRLVPSRLSVCALSSAAWEDQTPMPPLTNRGTASAAAGATPSHRSDETPTQAAWESVAEETVLSTSARPIVIDLEEGSDEESEESRLRHQQQNAFPIYSPGQELTDVWNDVERSVWAQLPFSECTFLPPTPGFRSALRQPDVPLMALNAVNGTLDPPPPPTSVTTIPWPDTPQAHHLLRLAESPVWQGQYFLCGWQCEPPTPSPSAVNMPADAPPPRISRPVAPSSEQLLSALRALNCALSQKPANEASPTLSSSSSTVPTCTASPAEVGSVLVSKSSSSADRWISLLCPRDTGTGCVSALRCLLCNFRTNSPAELAHHLSGPPAGTTSTTPTRCALCSQSVACNQATASFCSMKAHLLFHLGIFLTCPQCGFTPPPTLTPDLAELCLRLHLRFVCFHFNVVQKYLCSWPVCWKRTFTSLQNFIKHWVECHTASRFACLLCSKDASRDSDVKLATGDHAVNGNTNGPADGTRTSEASRILGHTTPAGAFKFADESSVVKHLRADHQVAEQHLASHSKEFYTTGHICSHCSLVCSSSLDLANHFTGTHCRILSSGSSSSSGCGANVASGGSAGPTPCESQCYFCCFNGCRRIYASAEELRQHLSSCPLAYRDLSVTFGRALNCQPPPPAPTNETVAPLAADSTDLQKPNPLCFCLYCGVGVGKRTRGTGTATPHQQVSDQQALISIDQSEDADAPAATSFPLQLEANTGDSSRPVSSSNSANEAPSASPAGAPSALAPPVPVNCASAFFPTISSLHAHERGHISYGGSGQIGCPWCGERLAYARFEDIQNILDHLFSHARDNGYVVWHLNRRKLQKKHPEEFLQCYCGAALDCPLAVCAHATQLPDRLEVDCPLTAYLRPVCEAASAYERTHQANEVGKLASTTAGGRSSETAKDGGGGGTGAGPKSATPDLCCRTSVIRSPLLPASHAPISVRVFDHLRFAVRPELDPLMSAFGAGSRGAFRCPICLSVEPTRWLLTEHAFTRHWTRLCYICCRHEHQDSNEQHAGPDFRPSHFEHSDHQLKEGNTADPSDSPSSSHGNAVPQPSRSTNTTDFWQHVFDCMLSRHLALLKAESASTVAYEATDEADSVTATDEMLATDQEMEGAETDEDEEEEVMESDQGEANAAVAEPLSSPPASARSLTEVSEPPSMGLSSSLSVSLGTTDRTSVRSSSAASRIVMSTSSALVPTTATSTVAVPTSPTISHSPNKSSSVLSLATSCETSQPSKMPRLEPSTPAVTPVLKTSPTTESVPTLSPQVPPPGQPSRTGTASTAPPSGGQFGKAISVPINEDPEGMRTHRICIVCGKKCTWDTYEEHMLEHRSPLLDWRGPLHDPARNNVPRERRTIYRCNVCERRFLQRTSCARHMLHFHKIERTALNWDDLVETLGNELLVNAPNTTRLPTFASRMPFEFPQQTTTPPGSRNGATSGPTLLSCAFCSAQFKNRKQLRQHVLVTHPSPEGSIWLPCPDCGLQFLSKKSLKIHTRGTHHRSPPRLRRWSAT
ncbi:hypothetical protein AAHC03_024441 [Spirometra sp. Aus1]